MAWSLFGAAVAAALMLVSPAAAQQAPTAAAQPAAQPSAEASTPTAERPTDLKVELAERRESDAPVITKRPRAVRTTTCRCGDPASQQ